MARLGDIIKRDGKEYFVISEHADRYIVFPRTCREATMLMKSGQDEVVGHMSVQAWFNGEAAVMKNCDSCRWNVTTQVISVCGRGSGALPKKDKDGDCAGWKAKHLTNAGRIRAMSDEQLANFLRDQHTGRDVCDGCPAWSNCLWSGDTCENIFLEWLKKDVQAVDPIMREE